MPQASAPSAPSVQVWLSPQAMVRPGSATTLFGGYNVNDAMAGIADVEQMEAVGRGIFSKFLT